MAKIPTYDIGGKITTEVSRAPIDPSKTDLLGKEVGAVGEGLTALGDHFKKIRDEQEITSAKVAVRKAADKIYSDAMKDPDVWGRMDKLDDLYQQAIDQAGGRIKSSEARNKFTNEIENTVSGKRTTLAMGLMNRQSQLYKGTYQDNLAELEKEYVTAIPQRQGIIRQEMQFEMQKAINLGAIHPDYAKQHLQTILDDLDGKTLKTDLANADFGNQPLKTIDNIESELKKGDAGHYKNIPLSKREAALKQVESARQKALKTDPERVKQVQRIADKKLTDKYIKNSLTESDLLSSQDKMSKTRFDLLSKNLLSGGMVYVRSTHRPEYSQMMDYISDPKNSESDVMDKLIGAENSGKLSPHEAKGLAQMFMVSPDDDPAFKIPSRPNLTQMLQAREESDKASAKKRSDALSWMGMLKQHFAMDKHGFEEAARRVVDAYNLEKDKNIKGSPEWGKTQAQKITSEDILKKYPGLATLPKEGAIKVDRYGNRIRFFPDGHYEVEKKKDE